MTKTQLLSQLPIPSSEKVGFPWNQETEYKHISNLNIDRDMKISIITPSFNQGHVIEETIRSVLLQNYEQLEYIIIDGGSTDNTVEIIRKYEKWISFWISESDNGQADAINKGLKKVTGEIVAYINSDDYYLPGTFYEVATYFQAHPGIDLLHGRCCYVDIDSQKIGDQFANIKRFEEIIDLWDVWWKGRQFVQPEVFWRKSIGDRVGLFNESLYFVMDYEYWCRILLFGGKVASLNRELTCFRFTDNQKSNRSEEVAEELLDVVKHWLWNVSISTPISWQKRLILQGQWIYQVVFLKQIDISICLREDKLQRWNRIANTILNHPQILFSPAFYNRIIQLFQKK